MNLYQPTISGSLVVSGSVSVIGPFTMSGGSITGTASFASNSGLLSNLDSGSFVGTGSFNTMSSSVSTRVTTIESKYATTGSNIFTGAQTVCANITSTGTIIAQTLNVQQVTSSVVYSSGSNVFGCSLSNTQQFTGSVTMTGSLNVAGNTCVVSICSPAHVGGTFSGTTIYGSTAICGGVICGGATTLTGTLTGTSATFSGNVRKTGAAGVYTELQSDGVYATGTDLYLLAPSTKGVYIYTNNTQALSIASTGAATFSSNVTASGDILANGSSIFTKAASGGYQISLNAQASTQKFRFDDLTGSTYGVLAFEAGNGSGGFVERMRITSGGNVGIANTSPCARLHVTLPAYTGEDTDSQQVIFGSGTAGYGVRIGYNESTNIGYINSLKPGVAWSSLSIQANNIIFAPSAVEKVRITNSGITCFACRVCAPSLTIAGTITTTVSPGAYEANMTYLGTTFNLGASEVTDTIDFKICGASASTTGNGFAFWTQPGNTTPSQRLRIDKNGIACFACTVCAPLFISPNWRGKSYAQTSSSGGTSIIDTCINAASYGAGNIYSVAWGGNPNAAGASYFSSKFGYIGVITGYNGNVVKIISYTQIANFENVGTLCLFPFFFDGTTECTTVCADYTGCIRIKICGYNASYPAVGQEVYITRLLG